jgi:hypothetical protein
MPALRLPTATGKLAPYTLRDATAWPLPLRKPKWNRVAFAAAHVVADPRADVDPWLTAAIDWDTTLAFRRHLWALGLRRCRGDGHRAARDGPRLADVARADPAQRRRSACAPGRVVFAAPAPITGRDAALTIDA